MGCDREASCVSLLHDRAHIRVSELSPHNVAPGRHHAATGHHLNDVHFALDTFPYGYRDLTAGPDLAAQVIAMPANGSQGWSGCHDCRLRLRCTAGTLDVAPSNNCVMTVTKITNRRDTGSQLPSQAVSDHGVELLIAERRDSIQRADLAVGDKMNMSVDKAWKHSRRLILSDVP
jgi:hypothetical protein